MTGASAKKPAADSAATELVKLAMARYDFGVADSGETFAVPKEGPKVVQMLRGGKTSLRSQLSSAYYKATRKAAGQQALADALLVLQGEAEETEEVTLFQRVAQHEGAIWLDLGDHTGRAIRIADGTWTIEDQSPVLFRRTVLNTQLPEPDRNGNIDELWSWLNVTKEDRPLVAAWLVATLYDGIPHPILGLFGEQGTGKTTAEKVLVSILDPSPVPTRKAPKDADAWVTAASGSWVVGLDNLSTMPDWLSDSLCRAVTGDGDVRRMLYADNSLVVFAFRRCLVVTGIDLGALNGDLAERLLSVMLEVIDAEKRIEENELWPRWAEAHPRILGAVLNLAAQVGALMPSITLVRKPRMADFARILCAVDEVLSTEGLKRYMEAQSTMATDALTGDQFVTELATAIRHEGGSFTGTAKEVLDLVAHEDEKWRPPKGWPANARAVTTKLRKQAPVMRKAGWKVTDDGGLNHDKAARWTFSIPALDPQLTRDDPHDPRSFPALTSKDGPECGSAGHAGHVSPTLPWEGSDGAGLGGSDRAAAICPSSEEIKEHGPRPEMYGMADPRDPQTRTEINDEDDEAESHSWWLASDEPGHPDCAACYRRRPSAA